MNTLEQSDACRYLTFPTILFNVVHKMNGQQKGYNLIYFRIDNLFEQHPVYHKHTHISTWEPDSVDASPDVSQLFTTLFSYLRCSIWWFSQQRNRIFLILIHILLPLSVLAFSPISKSYHTDPHPSSTCHHSPSQQPFLNICIFFPSLLDQPLNFNDKAIENNGSKSG